MTNAVTNKNPTPAVNQIFLLPLFYTFPAEVVAKSEFRDLPRNFLIALTDAQSLERIQSKQFLKDMIDMTAAMVWMHMGHRGWIEVYGHALDTSDKQESGTDHDLSGNREACCRQGTAL